MARRGRKTKLTKKVQEQICTFIRMGLTQEIAARAAGINPDTFYKWKSRGEKAKSGVHKEFSEALELAQAEAEMLHLKNLDELAHGGRQYTEVKIETDKEENVTKRTETTKVLLPEGKYSQWILARRFPERWGDPNESTESVDDALDEESLFEQGAKGIKRAKRERQNTKLSQDDKE